MSSVSIANLLHEWDDLVVQELSMILSNDNRDIVGNGMLWICSFDCLLTFIFSRELSNESFEELISWLLSLTKCNTDIQKLSVGTVRQFDLIEYSVENLRVELIQFEELIAHFFSAVEASQVCKGCEFLFQLSLI